MDRATGKVVGTGGGAASSTLGQVPASAEIEEVRGLSCGALDLEFAAEEDAARELPSGPVTGGKPVCTGSDPAAARSQTGAGLCVSQIF